MSLVFCSLLVPVAQAGAESCPDPTEAEKQAFEYLNQFRTDPNTFASQIGLKLNAKPAPPLLLDPKLSKLARAYAEQMATQNFVSHTDPLGRTPNQRLVAGGYRLPSDYPRVENSVEGIAFGAPTGREAINDLIVDEGQNPPLHRIQLLALTPFRRKQTHVGIGVACQPNSVYFTYYVVLTAPPPVPQ